MSGITNPDNGMMENQQAADLGHPLDEGAATAKGAAVESPAPRLAKTVDAMPANAKDLPDRRTEAARRQALAAAGAQPRGRR